jgi:DNA repair protein RadC
MGVHEGHRARLKQRFDIEGLDGFQPHEALELLLFHSVTRRDVNPLAHELIDRFGSFGGALAAGEEQLSQVTGVGARTSSLVSFLPEFFACYRAQRASDRPILRNLSATVAYCRHLIEGGRGDRLWMMHLSGNGSLLLAESLPAPEGYPRPRQVVERALVSRAQALVLASGRVGAKLESSDKAFAGTLADLLPLIGVTLLDGLLLDGEKTVSFRREGLLAPPLREASSVRLMERGWLWEGEEAEGTAGALPPDPCKGTESP